jgi:tetratricopeptide (TPR) repeat protein
MRIIIFLLTFALCACAGKEAGELQQKGLAAYKQGDTKTAIEYYNKALEENDSGEIRTLLGDTYFSAGNYDEAFYNYSRALTRNRNTAYLHYKRGEILYRLGKYNDAIMELDEAVSSKPKTYAKAYGMIGHAYLKQGDTRTAFHYLNRAVNRNPEDPETYILRAEAYLKTGKPELAIVDVTEALKLNPQSAKAHYLRGQILFAALKISDAIKDYEKAAELDPCMTEVYAELSWIYATYFDPFYRNGAKAVNYGKKAFELNPSNDNTIKLAAAYAENDQFDLAVGLLNEQIAQEKNLVEQDGLRIWKEMFEKKIKFRVKK